MKSATLWTHAAEREQVAYTRTERSCLLTIVHMHKISVPSGVMYCSVHMLPFCAKTHWNWFRLPQTT